jgi:hypothetical protein
MEKKFLESMHYCYLTTKNISKLKKIQKKWTFKFINSYHFLSTLPCTSPIHIPIFHVSCIICDTCILLLHLIVPHVIIFIVQLGQWPFTSLQSNGRFDQFWSNRPLTYLTTFGYFFGGLIFLEDFWFKCFAEFQTNSKANLNCDVNHVNHFCSIKTMHWICFLDQ